MAKDLKGGPLKSTNFPKLGKVTRILLAKRRTLHQISNQYQELQILEEFILIKNGGKEGPPKVHRFRKDRERKLFSAKNETPQTI